MKPGSNSLPLLLRKAGTITLALQYVGVVNMTLQ